MNIMSERFCDAAGGHVVRVTHGGFTGRYPRAPNGRQKGLSLRDYEPAQSSGSVPDDLSHVEVRRGFGAVLQGLEQLPVGVHVAITIAFVAVISVLDVATGNEVNLATFYVIPVVWATWFVGRRTGLATAVFSAIAWSAVERLSGIVYSSAVIAWWNLVVRFILLIFAAVLLAEIRELSEMRRTLAYSDPLTGISNTRIIEADLEREIARLRRYGRPFAFAYVDLDHFKLVNDSLGHLAGDDLLQQVALALSGAVRASDIVARLGGDEFGVLMPEAGEDDAFAALGRIVEAVNASLREVAPAVEGLGVTIGAMVFTRPPWSADHVIQLTDELMYDGKRSGRGMVRLRVFDGE